MKRDDHDLKARTLFAVRAFVAPAAAEVTAEIFSEYGARGVAIVDPEEIRAMLAAPGSLDYAGDDFLLTLGEKAQITGWFEGDERIVVTADPEPFAEVETAGVRNNVLMPPEKLVFLLEERLTALDSFFPGTKGKIETSVVEEKDWAKAWKRHYEVFHLGCSIVICPSWLTYEQQPGEHVLKLDPGLAFGTGTHETTALVAEAVEALLRPGDAMLDVGTGSGILALIGKMLGASRVTAVDIDPTAVKTASENAAQNDLDVTFVTGEIDAVEGCYDLIAANIVFDVLTSIAGDLYRKTKPCGHLIASGILAEKIQDFVVVMEREGYRFVSMAERNGWVAVVFERPL